MDDGQTVILDAGTTGSGIGEALADRHVTICTPSLRVALALASLPSVRLIMTGGIVRPVEQSLVGSAAIRMLEDHHFDLYIMTASGVHLDHGFSEWNPEDAELKRAALRVASRCIVVCDSSKVGHTAFARICDLDAVEMLVTDEGVPEEQRAGSMPRDSNCASRLCTREDSGASQSSRRRRILMVASSRYEIDIQGQPNALRAFAASCCRMDSQISTRTTSTGSFSRAWAVRISQLTGPGLRWSVMGVKRGG